MVVLLGVVTGGLSAGAKASAWPCCHYPAIHSALASAQAAPMLKRLPLCAL